MVRGSPRMVMTWAYLESLDLELGDYFRMTVDIVTDFQKAGPNTNFKKGGRVWDLLEG